MIGYFDNLEPPDRYKTPQSLDAARRLRAYAARTAQDLVAAGFPPDRMLARHREERRKFVPPRKLLGVTVGEASETVEVEVTETSGWTIESLKIMSGHRTLHTSSGDLYEEYDWHDDAILGDDGQLWLDQVRDDLTNGQPEHGPNDPTILDEGQYHLWDRTYAVKYGWGDDGDFDHSYEVTGLFSTPCAGLFLAIWRLRERAGLDNPSMGRSAHELYADTRRDHYYSHLQSDGAAKPADDSRFFEADAYLAAGDVDGAIAVYQRVVDRNSSDSDARARLAGARLVKRTHGADAPAAREAASARPADTDAQLLAADLDILGGHVDDAFTRLVGVVRQSAGDDRDRARQHLLGLFEAVGTDDPRVATARSNLSSALF